MGVDEAGQQAGWAGQVVFNHMEDRAGGLNYSHLPNVKLHAFLEIW